MAAAKRYIEHNGITKSFAEWAAEVGLSKKALGWRLRAGWDLERALTEPKGLLKELAPHRASQRERHRRWWHASGKQQRRARRPRKIRYG